MLVFTMSYSDASSTGQAGLKRKMRKRIFRGQLRALPPLPILHTKNGGARRDRTDDLLLAKHALSQLSYGPIFGCQNFKEAQTLRQTRPRQICQGKKAEQRPDRMVVGLGRLERPTSPLSGVRSNHLSYRPDATAAP